MTQMLAIGAITIVLYVYVVFPLLVLLRGWIRPRPWQQGECHPSVDVVIICYNEASVIRDKLDSVFRSDYPLERLRVIVASDGSSDGTDEIVRSYGHPNVTFHSYPRRGKIPALNDAVTTSTSEVLVFTDANSQFQADSITNLVRHFADPQVGCVAGNQVYTKDADAGAAAAGEQSYWNFDRLMKRAQCRAGNATSATGALYAIRRDLFQTVPSGVTDDFTISTRTILQGQRLVFDPEAIASEAVAGKPKAEYRRKVRVMTRGLRAVWMVRGLLNPFRYGFYSLQLFSHKLLRRLVAFPLLLLLILTPWMWAEGGWLAGFAVMQAAFYLLALIGYFGRSWRLAKLKPFSIPQFFCLVNIAAIAASLNVLFGRKIDRWDSHRIDGTPDLSQSPATASSR